jgi:magnesium transporter
MTNTLYLPELRQMLAENNVAEMEEFCTALHPARTAEFMEGLDPQESWAILQHTDPHRRMEIFSYFDRDKQKTIIETIDRKEAAELISLLPPDDRVDILKEVDPAVMAELLPLVAPEHRRDILRLTAYPENTAGARMTTNYARVLDSVSVRQALDEIIRQAEKLETIYYIYVVDEQEHLVGVVSARDLVSALAKPDLPVREIMETELITVLVTEDQEEVARKVADFDLLAIPVVDDERHLLGIITHDDVIDTVMEEATEDAHRMGGITPMVDNFLEMPFVTVWRKRAGWLCMLFVAELFTFTALAHFEAAIQAVVALALFVPLCISTGGNSGSQAATLVTRALAVGQVTTRDWWRVLRHELLMGIALGCTLGLIGFLRAALTPQTVLGAVNHWTLAFVIAQSVAAICLWGTLVGSMLPLIFKRLGFDPGFASSPFVATFVDVTGIIIYFNIAHLWLPLG